MLIVHVQLQYVTVEIGLLKSNRNIYQPLSKKLLMYVTAHDVTVYLVVT